MRTRRSPSLSAGVIGRSLDPEERDLDGPPTRGGHRSLLALADAGCREPPRSALGMAASRLRGAARCPRTTESYTEITTAPHVKMRGEAQVGPDRPHRTTSPR